MNAFRRSGLLVMPLVVVLSGLCEGDDRPKLQRFTANGVRIAYFVQGDGEPVVLIHGWLSRAGINWLLPGTSALLAKDHQVIALDVRGHGLSDKPMNEAAYGTELVEKEQGLGERLALVLRYCHVRMWAAGMPAWRSAVKMASNAAIL